MIQNRPVLKTSIPCPGSRNQVESVPGLVVVAFEGMGTFLSKIILVGVGLLGGSLGLAVKKRKLAEFVIGVDSNPERLEEALRVGAIDRSANSLAEAFELLDSLPSQNERNAISEKPIRSGKYGPKERFTDLLLVCTPVGAVANVILEAAQVAEGRRLLITDVGSTKYKIARKLDKQLPSHVRYIGSHPIAGSEKSGPKHAEADLFVGRLTVLTPLGEEMLAETTLLEHFWNLLGSSVIQIPPKQHDSILARTSHFPHLLAMLMLQMLKIGDHIMVGPGFRSTTRLAGSDPALWTDVFMSNKEAVCEAIDTMQKRLESFRRLLEEDDQPEILKQLTRSKKQRDALEK